MIKKSFKKKILAALTAIAMLVTITAFTGCDNVTTVFAWYEGSSVYDNFPIVMNAGETFTVNNSHLSRFSVSFETFEVWVSSENGEVNLSEDGFRLLPLENTTVVTIEGNTITAGHSGRVGIAVTLIRRRNGNIIPHSGVHFAIIYVVNEDTMTHITTPQELADINNDLNGHFILMNDIYLCEWGEWLPIGRTIPFVEQPYICNCHLDFTASQSGLCLVFRGMFVNPHGYKIRNLTITTSATDTTMRGTLGSAGLFGAVHSSVLIYGVILEDIFIDVSDYNGDIIGAPSVGGIAGNAHGGAKIINSFVRGEIIGGGEYTGGIVGLSAALIVNCTFKGYLKNLQKEFSWSIQFGLGGIVGFNSYFGSARGGNIINCTVYADIYGGEWAIVGGIVGVAQGRAIESIRNSSFAGTVTGRMAGTMIGRTSSDESVNFE